MSPPVSISKPGASVSPRIARAVLLRSATGSAAAVPRKMTRAIVERTPHRLAGQFNTRRCPFSGAPRANRHLARRCPHSDAATGQVDSERAGGRHSLHILAAGFRSPRVPPSERQLRQDTRRVKAGQAASCLAERRNDLGLLLETLPGPYAFL